MKILQSLLIPIVLALSASSYAQTTAETATGNKADQAGPGPMKEMVNLNFTVDGIQRTAALYVPGNYNKNKQWPLIVFLHGGGGNGDNEGNAIPWASNTLLAKYLQEMEGGLQALVLFPRCPPGKIWAAVPGDSLMSAWRAKKFGSVQQPSAEDHIARVIEQTLADYSVDKSRISLCGFSMGGEGSIRYAAVHHDRFYAVAPIAGSAIAIKSDAPNLAKLKVWMFQGGKDDVSTPELGRKMSAWIKAAGGDVRYTEYPDATHGGSNYKAVRESGFFEFLTGE